MKTVVIRDPRVAASPPKRRAVRRIDCTHIAQAVCDSPIRRTPDINAFLTAHVGLLIDVTEMKTMHSDAANVTIFPKCPSRPLSDWIADLQSGGDNTFLFQRPRFVADVGFALMTARKAAGYKRKAFAKKTGLARATIYEIESGDRIGGSPIGKVAAYLAGCDASIVFTLTPQDGGSVIYHPFSAKRDPGVFCGDLVRNLRRAAGLTQAELNHHIRLPAAMERPDFDADRFAESIGTAAPQISAIERLAKPAQDKPRSRTLRLGTLFTIAYFCGYTLGVKLETEQ